MDDIAYIDIPLGMAHKQEVITIIVDKCKEARIREYIELYGVMRNGTNLYLKACRTPLHTLVSSQYRRVHFRNGCNRDYRLANLMYAHTTVKE